MSHILGIWVIYCQCNLLGLGLGLTSVSVIRRSLRSLPCGHRGGVLRCGPLCAAPREAPWER